MPSDFQKVSASSPDEGVAMQLETFCFDPESGWTVPAFPDLDSSRTLVIVFGAPEFMEQPQPLLDLVQAYPAAQVVGCSTAGEIHGTWLRDHTLAVAVLQFEATGLASTTASVKTAEQSFFAGKRLAQALYRPDLRGVFVLSDGTHVNGSELVRGLNKILPNDVVVTGGLAGDGERFGRTWTLHQGRPAEDRVSAVGLYGERVRICHGSRGGWDIFGPERKVTRSKGNVLYELDGRPALQLYQEYLGDRAAGLPATALLFPLSLRAHVEDQKSVVRTVLGIDEEQNAMIFAGDIPEGFLTQLMKANFDRLVEGASEAARIIGSADPPTLPLLCIAISCVGRRLVLGERTEEELEAALEVLPAGTRQIGFYSYGEISPYTSGHCDLHNQTMTLTTIGEGR